MRTAIAIIAAVATVAFAPAVYADTTEAGESEADAEVAVDDTDHPALFVGYTSAWKFFGGFAGGASFSGEGTGGYTGTQFSVVRTKHGRWLGLQTGIQYDFGASSFMATAGPEFGYKFGGIDAGAAARFGGEESAIGPQGRLIATVGVLSLVGRYGFFPALDEHLVQVGLVLKGPLTSPRGHDPF